jgi:hypothetical protein
MFAAYKFESCSAGMGMRGGNAQNLKKTGYGEKMEERSKAPPFARKAGHPPRNGVPDTSILSSDGCQTKKNLQEKPVKPPNAIKTSV